MSKYYNQEISEVLSNMNTNANGLTEFQVNENREKFGLNELVEANEKGVIQVFLSQFKDLLVIILILAGGISLAADNAESTIVIFSVIILNAILGTIQHFKAQESLKSLKSLSAPYAKVLRDGKKIEIPSKELVVGDILLLEAGDLVAADGRIIENYSLQVNESSLTGESLSVEKNEAVINKEKVALGDHLNMVFSSSLVTYGRATVVVTSTGMNTEIGKIATLMNATKEKTTPLQKSLDDFSKKLSIAVFAICVIVFFLTLRNEEPLNALMFAVALAVAAIPEALGSIVTIALAIGTQKMAKENAIIKNLKAVEGLGCVSIICSDKTGTLTQNKMTVQKIFVNGEIIEADKASTADFVQSALLTSSILCNDSIVAEGKSIGDPTEIALTDFYIKLHGDYFGIRTKKARLAELPFDSDRKLMSTLHRIDNKYLILTKGAIDVMLKRVKTILTNDGAREITQEEIDKITQANYQMSTEGLRVLAFAQKELPEKRGLSFDDEDNLTFIGLVTMADPPRVESKAAVADCFRAGIKPIMITGDHKITAISIAKKIGIFKDGDMALDGIEIDTMNDEQLAEVLDKISVYARVSPEHKIRIVDAWQKKGNIVAMTGDGVNDAPALKKADIGIAMGITGTAVSKDAASMILTDDNFATIIKSVANGRNIYSNIKNSIKFLLSGNMSGIFAVIYTAVMGLSMPFTAVHLLFINLLTDSLPAIAISTEKADSDLLNEKPRGSTDSIMTKQYFSEILWQGLLIAVFTILSFYKGLQINAAVASTMAFATLCLARLFHGFNCRSKKSLFKIGLLTNKFSLLAFASGVIFLGSALLIPPLQVIFQCEKLSLNNLGFIALMAFLPTLIIQIVKVGISFRKQKM